MSITGARSVPVSSLSVLRAAMQRITAKSGDDQPRAEDDEDERHSGFLFGVSARSPPEHTD